MKQSNDRETVLWSSQLEAIGIPIAKLLMAADGVKIEALFNLLGEMSNDISDLRDQVEGLEAKLERVRRRTL